jgi:fermentation-respiration switch protein FrsA (DUF1100 family)
MILARDRIVPIEYGRRLYEAAADPKTFLLVAGATSARMAPSKETFT